MVNEQNIEIVQGATWEKLRFLHPRDLSGGVAIGQIRNNFLEKSGTLYANIEFLPLVYGVVDLVNSQAYRTIIVPRLNGTITSQIPATKSGKSWVYDIFVRIGVETIEIARGEVTVIPRVTELV